MKVIFLSFAILLPFNGAWAADTQDLTIEEAHDIALLCSHDLLTAKTIIIGEASTEYRLANILLHRAATCETDGEVEFYSALLGFKQGKYHFDSPELIELLSKSAERANPFALAQLYRMSQSEAQSLGQSPEYYKERFELEKFKRTTPYPELSKALEITKKMFGSNDQPERN